jgi:DNA-binding CsgD family transcriptional regulator/ArsR family metal-binding transcriptional regulator
MDKSRFISSYSSFSLRLPVPPTRGRALPEGLMIAEFEFGADISGLAPYINAVAKNAMYYEKPPYIRFLLHGVLCTLNGSAGSAVPFSDRSQALDFLERLIAFLNGIHLHRNSIQPSYRSYAAISVLDVLRLLPRSNCWKCGFPTCMAFAAALSRRKTASSLCPEFKRPIALKAIYPVLDGKGNLLSTVSIDIDADLTNPSSRRERPMSRKAGKQINETQRSVGAIFEKLGNEFLPSPLTPREVTVLTLIAEGATNVEISNELHISPHTVKSHVIHIFNKLGVFDRTQAAVWATRHNLV